MINPDKIFAGSSLCLAVGLITSLLSQALPPAPPHTILGDVRDEFGKLLTADGSKVQFSRAGRVIGEAAILPPGRDHNYRMDLSIDLRLTGTSDYISTAVASGEILSIGVDIGGVMHLPIEIGSSGRTVGAPAQSSRLNLTLGEDTDSDGLPDAWEISQLFYADISPGANGWDLALLNRNDDFDKDGASNWTEYIAGTYATDASSIHSLRIAALRDSEVEFRLYTIHGKSYQIQSSPDLRVWSNLDCRLGTGSGYTSVQTASTTGETTAFSPRPTHTGKTYFRLTIR
jgi:hypothetical protein